MDIQQRKADRLRVMNAIFEGAAGSELAMIDTGAFADDLSMDEQGIVNAVQYLEGEGLIESFWDGGGGPPSVHLTHRGIVQIEAALEEPAEPSQYFPPVINVLNVSGTVIGSSIAQAGGQASAAQHGSVNVEQLRGIVEQVRTELADLNLAPDVEREVRADLDTARAQLDSPRPKTGILRPTLLSVRAAVEAAGGTVLAQAIMEGLAALPA